MSSNFLTYANKDEIMDRRSLVQAIDLEFFTYLEINIFSPAFKKQISLAYELPHSKIDESSQDQNWKQNWPRKQQ